MMALGNSSIRTACVSRTHGKNDSFISSNSAPALEGDYILIRFSSFLPILSCNNGNARYNNSSIKENRPHFLPGLIPGDSAVILPVVIPAANKVSPTKPLLDMIGLEEIECLNPSIGGPGAGQCQFACISTALSDSFVSLGHDSRLDLELRRLALRVIETNPTMYQDFLTTAGCRTRSKSLHGGSSVDMKGYISTMSNPTCDGDAVTLQALCDALKITVRFVKLIEADLYDPAGQTERLMATSKFTSNYCQGFIDTRETSSLIFEEDSCSFGSSSTSLSCESATSHASLESLETRTPSSTSASNPFTVKDKGARKRLYISQDIEPRNLSNVDADIKRFTPYSQGRLIWLSHVGDEAHYRLLRLKHQCDVNDYCVFNRDEEITASESRMQRLLKLQASNQLDNDFGEKLSTERLPLTCVKIGVNPMQVGNGRCSLCLKTLYDDSFETRGLSSFCDVQCLSLWPTVCDRKTPYPEKHVVNLVDDTQAPNPIRNLAVAVTHSDTEMKNNRVANKSYTNRSTTRSEIFLKLRTRPPRTGVMARGHRKRPIRPVDRYVAKM